MTEYYARPSFRLDGAPTSTKILLTLFLISVLVATGVAVVNQYVRSGHTSEAIATYYLGSEEELVFPKPVREMLSISHVHLFGMPILLFILCHIFDLASVRQGIKSALFIGAFGAVFLQIGAPWLIRYFSSDLALLLPASFIVMSAVILVLTVIPLREMWFSSENNSKNGQQAEDRL